MNKKEFKDLYKQLYVSCLNYRMQERMTIGKLKLKQEIKNKSLEDIKIILEETVEDMYEFEHPFFFEHKEIATSAMVDTESFISELRKHFLSEDFKEFEECLTDEESEPNGRNK
jgi:hypothetical protein